MVAMTQAQAHAIARGLLDHHGKHDWTIVYDDRANRAGAVHYPTKRLFLSLRMLAQRDGESSMDTITHEVAHVLTPGHHHDEVWKAKHRELGGSGARLFHQEQHDPKAKYHGTCPHGNVFNRYKRWAHELQQFTLMCNCKPRETHANRMITWTENR